MFFDRSLYYAFRFVIVGGLVAVVGLLLFIVAGEWSFDGQELDVQTFALLAGGIGYGLARGMERTDAIEAGFVASVATSIYASLTRDASPPSSACWSPRPFSH